MRRSRLLIGLIVAGVSGSALAQPVMSPYAEPVQSPYDAPPPPAPPPVPPPIVAPAPQPCQYPYNCQYGQPQYAQPQPYYYQPAPRTFHEESQPRYGLMVAGLVVFGASYSINAATAYIADEWRLAVPVAGPFMEISQVNTSSGYEYNRPLVGLLVFDGLIETAGAVMFLTGALTHHKVKVYDRPSGAQVSIVPTAGAGAAGVAAFGRF